MNDYNSFGLIYKTKLFEKFELAKYTGLWYTIYYDLLWYNNCGWEYTVIYKSPQV